MGCPSPSPRALLALCLVVPAVAARAESGRARPEVDPRNLDATSSPTAVIGLATSAVSPHLAFYGGLTLSWARDELVLRGATRDLPDPLTDRLVSTLGLGLGLFDALELELALPLHLSAAAGDDAAAGLGDTHLTLRWRMFGSGEGAGPGFGLGLHLGLGLPTGGAAPFSSDQGPSLDPRLVADWRGADGTTLAAQVGYCARPDGGVLDLALGDELRFGAGLELPFGALGAPIPASLLTEVEGAVGLATADFDPDGAGTARKRPLELRLGLRWRGPPWIVTVATGTGLGGGYGTPDHRVLLALGWSSGPSPVPAPPARIDQLAVRAPEPRPDFGADVVGLGGGLGEGDPGGPTRDAAAEAALEAALAADPDSDGDGVIAAHDACPEAREDLDGNADADGCPDPDDDQDGVLDAADRCPTEREVLNGVLDEDGCPDEGAETIVARDDTIELDQTIEFRSGSDVLAPSAAPILAQLAGVLRAHPEVERVRIEGHTDAEGHPEQNVDLSERRAARVRAELVRLGIAPTRLVPKGFGATRPVASNANAAGRQRNRRVELHILRDAPPAPEATP